MKEKRINLWNEAGKAGLVLGTVSILYMIITLFTGKIAGSGIKAILIGTLNFALWAGKLVLCIWLMRFFLLKFSKSNPSADNNKVFRFGMLVALLSALLYSAFYLVYILYIDPNSMAEAFDLAIQQYSASLDAQSMEALENIKSDMPTISFFAQLSGAGCSARYFLQFFHARYLLTRTIPSHRKNNRIWIYQL